MGLPIMTALFGIGIGLAVVNLLARVLDVPSFAPQVTAMIGIGVGIDYALFISTRYREALHEGADPEARGRARDRHERPGRALRRRHRRDLAARPVPDRRVVHPRPGGRRVARGAVRDGRRGHAAARGARLRRPHDRQVRAAERARRKRDVEQQLLGALEPHAAGAGRGRRRSAGSLILLVLAIPFVSLRLGVADAGNDPTKFTTRRAYDLLSEGFGPGFNGPLLLASEVRRRPATSPRWTRSRPTIANDPGVAAGEPGDPEPERQGRAASRSCRRARRRTRARPQLVHRLRDDVIPAATRGHRRSTCTSAARPRSASTSPTRSGQRLPYMFLAILFLSFVLLMLVFRSLLVPLKAVIMNLLSIGAAYGVIVAIFQWGWVKDVVGIGKEGPIEAWVPMMLFAIVFGLSMDYEVFLLSRIKEEYDRDHDNADAVAHGLAKTARLITAAAAIMICVFGSFVLSDLRVLKLDRLRARVRGVHRRDGRAARARARDDGAARRPQLVVPELARVAPPRPRRGQPNHPSPRRPKVREPQPVAGD